MRVATLSALVLVAACGGIRAPASVRPSWEPLFGTYAFRGMLSGQTQPVTGTLRLGPDGYQLSSSYGTCHGQLDASRVGPEFGARCERIGVSFRQIEGGIAEEGMATVMVPELRKREECSTNADGQLVCVTVEDLVLVPQEIRLEVRTERIR